MMWRIAALAALMAGPTLAQDVVNGATARGLLFNATRVEVAVSAQSFLSEGELDILRNIAAENVPYYGAIAVSPDDGLATEATTARGNYHDAAAASAAVLADCNAKRSRGSQPCVVVVQVRPRGWQARPLQLSAGATAAFNGEYRRGQGEKAFAISPSTGGFGVGRGAGAAASATASCNAAGGANDCRIVVAD